MVDGLLLIENAISEEYANSVISGLPDDFLGVFNKGRLEDINKNLWSEDLVADLGAKRASLQLHHFAPLPEFVSMVSEDVIPQPWKDRVWNGQDCNCSIVQGYRAGEGTC